MATCRTLVSSFLKLSISSNASSLRFPISHHGLTSVAGIRTEVVPPKLVIPPPPKRPPTAYMQFVKEKMQEYMKRSPGIKVTAHVKIIALEWKKLEDAKKQRYQEKYQADLLKYKESEALWKEGLNPAQQDAVYQSKQDAKIERSQKKARRAKRKLNMELKKLGKPKKPRTAFTVFVMERVKPNGPKLRQVLIEAGQAWRKLSPEEKEPYYIVQAKGVEQYQKEMDSWKKKMEKDGFAELVAPLKHHPSKKKDAPTTKTKKVTKRRSKGQPKKKPTEPEE